MISKIGSSIRRRRDDARIPSDHQLALAIALGFGASVALALLIYAGFCWALG
jgi:hypothetical protein